MIRVLHLAEVTKAKKLDDKAELKLLASTG